MKIDGRGGQPASTGRAGAGPAGYQALQIAQRGEQALGAILFTYPSSRGILLETRTGGAAMARTTAELPQGTRITDYVSLGVIARTVPLTKVHEALTATESGSILDVADERANEEAFGRPGASRGGSAYPQIRFVALVENGTHALFGTRMSGCWAGEVTLARSVLPGLQQGMLCLADRQFFGFELFTQARATGAD